MDCNTMLNTVSSNGQEWGNSGVRPRVTAEKLPSGASSCVVLG